VALAATKSRRGNKMSKLWEKKSGILDPKIEKFTVGNDYILDLELLPYDILASEAHAKMLGKQGYLNDSELEQLLSGLDEIKELHNAGKFDIIPEDEDCHTAIENFLVKKYGDVGKKIHTARSRNDQSMVALRLLIKDNLNQVKEMIAELQKQLESFADKNKGKAMPGYTHMRKAMPSSVDMLFLAYHEMLADELEIVESIRGILDKNPLGSAAGYGVPLKIDLEMTTKELGFAKLQDNPIHCANSRGKYEAKVISALLSIMQSLNKMASDLILFTMPEFGFFELSKHVTTGSSIMPQKKNPDVLELVRANAHVVNGEMVKVNGIILNLPSGYSRDFQLTKEPLLKSLKITIDSLDVMSTVISGLKTKDSKLSAAMTDELYATEKAYKLVEEGMPFRDAYKKVAKSKGY
jgi:argininosuccinate lyase